MRKNYKHKADGRRKFPPVKLHCQIQSRQVLYKKKKERMEENFMKKDKITFDGNNSELICSLMEDEA